VAIITDTAADLPEEVQERLNIHLMPLRVNFGSKSYLDKVSITADEFYAEMLSNPEHPQTSQAAPRDYRRQYPVLGRLCDAECALTVSAKVSGTWQAAVSAAQRADGEAVQVIDTRSVATGQGLLVAYAAECALAGYSAPEITRAVDDMR